MRTFIFITIAVFLALIIVIVGIGLFFGDSDEVQVPSDTTDPVVGTANNVPPDTDVDDSVAGFFVRSKDSAPVEVEQLVNHSSTEARAENFYRTTYDPDVYSIYYNRATQVIFIDIYQQPIAESRQFAEAHLLEVLDLSEDEICNLAITVQTNAFVDPQYADQNLGLSFCEQ